MRGENVQINSVAEDSGPFRGDFLKDRWPFAFPFPFTAFRVRASALGAAQKLA